MDLTVTLGDIIGAAGPIAAVIGAYIRLSDRLRTVEIRTGVLWRRFERRVGESVEEEE